MSRDPRQVKTVIAERDALRAELAAAKNLLARIHRDGGHHTQAVGFTQSVADAGDRVSEWLLAAEERDALRAELAAAKERGDGLYLGLRQTLEALGGVAQPGVSEAFLILGVPGEAAAIKRLNTALAADNARLRSVLVWLDRIGGLGLDVHARITEALAAAPAQSLAAHDAAVKVAVLREVADREFNPDQSAEERWAHGVLHGNADRIEKEAQRG